MKKKARRVQWAPVLLLSIFTGSLGIDRFVMGHTGLGICKLLTAGGFGIWWLVDVVLIAMKYAFRDIIWTSLID